ncbi:hypothetical protein LHU53_12090 [Rhodoferax sp. U2-2l]|uniref:hypothetical protein n=1 Tax=Rhodoferax sp. U2-2l TaxID=2884000 RepID=UPI001D09FB3E|nr:hypothetical protein [Rhodoferax sp. U2-2l]MCB8747645.1 hypothetical protein [Rhodoferax sp. U2-2l]
MSTITPTPGNLPRYATTSTPHPDRLALHTPPTTHSPTEAALRSILLEVTPGIRPYSSESYLPDHMVKAAQSALDGNSLAARQHAHNALSTAAWHIARGEAPQALARLRRAQSHIMASMEGGAA